LEKVVCRIRVAPLLNDVPPGIGNRERITSPESSCFESTRHEFVILIWGRAGSVGQIRCGCNYGLHMAESRADSWPLDIRGNAQGDHNNREPNSRKRRHGFNAITAPEPGTTKKR
jgi:hypothetical protein